jgi:hypothetical protein
MWFNHIYVALAGLILKIGLSVCLKFVQVLPALGLGFIYG